MRKTRLKNAKTQPNNSNLADICNFEEIVAKFSTKIQMALKFKLIQGKIHGKPQGTAMISEKSKYMQEI